MRENQTATVGISLSMRTSRGTARNAVFAALGLAAATLVAGVPAAQAEPGCVSGMNDFNNDGRKDVVVGIPNASIDGHAGAGAVEVRMRDEGGAAFSRTITAPNPHAGDHFGAAVGDVDLSSHVDEMDGCSSLVVGAPGTDVNGEPDAGVVYVFQTLDSAPAMIDQNFTDEAPGTQPGAHFGAAVTEQSTGSNGNNLVRPPVFYAAAPDYDLGVTTDAGVVQRIDIEVTENGLTSSTQTITAASGYLGSSQVGDRFGAAMTGTPYEDELVIGAPGRTTGSAKKAGAIFFWTPTKRQLITQDSTYVPGANESGDAFGSAVFIGSEVKNAAFTTGHDVPIRILVGVPREDVAGKADAGGVMQLTYTPHTETDGHGRIYLPGAVFWTQNTAGVAGSAETGDLFGSSVESLDLTSGGAVTFVAGAPGEDLGGVIDTGGVATLGGNQWYDEASPGVPGTRERGDRFGAVLGSARDIYADRGSPEPPGPGQWSRGLLVGSPGENTGDGTIVIGLPHGSVTSGTRINPPVLDGAYGSALGATR